MTVANVSAKPARLHPSGSLIINADDWGRDRETTDRIFDCLQYGSLSSASGMMFMKDSERSAALSREISADIGLHLNLTSPFSSANGSLTLAEHQSRVISVLRKRRRSQVLFYPRAQQSFEYVVAAQIDEFERLYGVVPIRIDGHHHMHLCANVIFGRLLPKGTIIRRNFTFRAGERGLINRLYRRALDRVISRRHRLADIFCSLPPLEPKEHLDRIISLAKNHTVEVGTHPAHPEEYEFLTTDKVFRWAGDVPITSGYRI